MSICLVQFLLLSIVCGRGALAMWSEMEVVSIENVGVQADAPMTFDLVIKRIAKGEFGISGSIRTTAALADYDVLAYTNHFYKVLVIVSTKNE